MRAESRSLANKLATAPDPIRTAAIIATNTSISVNARNLELKSFFAISEGKSCMSNGSPVAHDSSP